jgi:LPXTG-motif cell wall-anchored protein
MSFDNCTEAYAAGRSDIPKGDPDYAPKLDRDNDGYGCDNPPAGFQPRQGETQTGTKVQNGADTPDQLPKTGPAAELGLAGGAVLLLGVVAVALRRRRVHFRA